MVLLLVSSVTIIQDMYIAIITIIKLKFSNVLIKLILASILFSVIIVDFSEDISCDILFSIAYLIKLILPCVAFICFSMKSSFSFNSSLLCK